tara:strand:+ start:49 stop:1071 length:1023 start_codon:yes stop_codon:yes gene_type:complete
MINEETVIVLGAGASFDYGLPLGPQLTEKAVEFLHRHQETKFDDWAEIETDLNGYSNLAKILQKSRTPTLDAFIEKNNTFAPPLKAAIAGVLLELEDKAISSMEFPDGDWVSWLYHNRMESCPESFKNNRLSFVSFNYDRIPMALFARFMANTHQVDIEHSLRIVSGAMAHALPQENFGHVPDDVHIERFIHVHGQVGTELKPRGTTEMYSQSVNVDNTMLQSIDSSRKVNGKYLNDISKNIVTISENEKMPDENAYARMKILLSRASKIIILGLGYHDKNLDKIGLTSEFVKSNRLKFIGGTGIGLGQKDRDRLLNRFGSKFKIGDDKQDCLSFLQEYF